MEKDTVWKKYFSDNSRYADIINGIGCKGEQLVTAADLCDADTRAGKKKDRDLLRKAAFGMNFALIGVENQENIDYSLPLRNMVYDAEEWNGSRSLREMIDFTDIPECLKEMTPDYKINVIEIRKLENTECFKTDVRQVFNFIRCSEDKNALKQLIASDRYYHNMEEDAFDVAVSYTNATELISLK